MYTEKIESIINEVIGLYVKFGSSDYIGEAITQIEHMCQAAMLAEELGYDEEVVLAAFFHDIGHLCENIMKTESMDGFGVAEHEKLGASYLSQKGFSPRICKLVESHVAAKRYLTYKYPEYYRGLSEASKRTLEFQGGMMSAMEAETMELDPDFELIILLRNWDEQAKLVGIPLPSLERYKEKMRNHLSTQLR